MRDGTVRRILRRLLAGTVMAVAGAVSAAAQDAAGGNQDGFRVQLNKMSAVSEACRIYLVFENRTGEAYDAYTLDLVMFDADGEILRRLAVEAGAMPEGKTRVKPFDLSGTDCANVGKILLNEVMTCEGPQGGGSSASCTKAAHPESRIETPFIK